MTTEATTYEQYIATEQMERPAPVSMKGQQQAVEVTSNLPHRSQGGDFRWQDFAACKGAPGIAELFFPPSHFERKDEKLGREERAKKVCGSCAVRQACLDYAIRIREPHGVWGGLNEKERKNVN